MTSNCSPAKRRIPVALHDGDIADAERDCVLARDRERVRLFIDRDDFRTRALGCDADRNTAAPGTEIEDPRRRVPRNAIEREIDEELRLGPGDENRGRDLEGTAIEFALAGEISDRLAERPPRDERVVVAPLRVAHRGFGVRDQIRRITTGHVAQQSSRIDRVQQLGLVLGDQRVGQLEEIAVHDRRDLVEREIDAVIGDAALRKVVGADALGAVAAADQRACASPPSFALLLAHLLVLDARGEHAERARLVLVLRSGRPGIRRRCRSADA